MKKILLLIGFTAFFAACSSDNGGSDSSGDGYDRTALLTNWADNLIIPSFENYQIKVAALQTKVGDFTAAPSETGLGEVRTAWIDAYKAFQYVSQYEIGKAEQIKFVSCTNAYPTNATGIETNIASGTYNFSLLSQLDKQGFPAIDYMVNGLADDDASIVAFYTSNSNAAGYKLYLTNLTARLKTNVDLIVNDWNGNYRAAFIGSNGNSASSSVNRMVNLFVKNYETYVRSGKVGLPAGVFSEGITFTNKVEAYYKNDISKILLNEGVKATQDFFNGKYFNSEVTGPSLKTYLDYLNVVKDGQRLSTIINNQYTTINSTNALLGDSFSEQILIDNGKMIASFDQMQWNVVYFKLDMIPAMKIVIDYVDNDGD
ncbi:irpA protein [Flavobacterium enshiense DK69]|uniref:Iron-regulated protein A n=1 Tax=Flavobacterium enshiense DK69 TaxID=1107311 RepID=V6SG89_9FLAO|nr:imelysin family protein [Flavobacterium enshiense]ESU25267.1 irpA protein [Flavobacterium enshiense DK69]KGO93171.1 iron-regulated protein A precursor [Flavobacterium enshiense DK69]